MGKGAGEGGGRRGDTKEMRERERGRGKEVLSIEHPSRPHCNSTLLSLRTESILEVTRVACCVCANGRPNYPALDQQACSAVVPCYHGSRGKIACWEP